MGEIGLAGDRAERGELRRGEAHQIRLALVRVRYADEHGRLGRGGARELQGGGGFSGHGLSISNRGAGVTHARAGSGTVFPLNGRSCRSTGKSGSSRGTTMTAIIDIIGREILDSRGNPTVEVDV